MPTDPFERPRWMRDLLRFLPLKPQFVLSGNVRDLQLSELTPGTVTSQPLLPAMAVELLTAGFEHLVAFDPVTGFRPLGRPGADPAPTSKMLEIAGIQMGCGAPGLDTFADALQRLVTHDGGPVAVVVDFASRLTIRAESLSPAEHSVFTRALALSQNAQARPWGTPPKPFFNTTIWVVDKEGDLPDWLLIDNPRIRHIPVAKPDHRARRALAAALLRGISGFRGASPEDCSKALDAIVESTEGFCLFDLTAIAQLARSEGLGFEAIGDAVRRYKVGVTEDPWARIDRNKIRKAGAFVGARVKGQDHAVAHVLDIVKRAVTGVGASRRGGRPRGVAFLAGPTGVGKTELAKTLTSLLFGDESAYIRFDMSEFSAEHSDQRLIGAPPGYIGYDVGGELTNAIREKPFSVVLFDEIEKAHPRILDKFLQILDDGVLSSGRGDRVYFSEAFVVFTSNLGIFKLEPDGRRVPNVTPDEPLEVVRAKVRAEIDRHFKQVLNRPEILNRIGENILVFDFIRRPVAEEIFAGMVQSILDGVRSTQGIAVSLSDQASQQLGKLCLSDLTNGGRGIRNQVETHLVNPLARALFDTDVTAGTAHVVTEIRPGPVTSLALAPAAAGARP